LIKTQSLETGLEAKTYKSSWLVTCLDLTSIPPALDQ